MRGGSYGSKMFGFLANPARFMALSRWLAPLLGALAAVLLAIGLWLSFAAPDDYQQGATVRIMFVHVPAAFMATLVYACLGGASLIGLIFRHSLADAAAKAAAPLGAAFTALALVTGSLWGKPMWGTWWAWDARMTSVLVLFLLYLGYMALHAAIDDEQKAARAAAILALVGLVNLPIVKFSVDWWNTLHQGESIFRPGGPTLAAVYLWPLGVMSFAYAFLFGSLWLVRIRAEVWKRRAGAAALRAAA
jgi:heme exporter protein C